MARYLQFPWGFILIGIFVIGPVGCRFDNDRSGESNVDKETVGGRAGSGREDGQSSESDIENDNTSGTVSGEQEGDRSGESDTERGSAGVTGGENISSNTVTGTVRDLVTDEPLEGMRVVALSNKDLSEIGIEAKTGYDGGFALEGITDKEVCIKVVGSEGEDARIDVCHCNIPSDDTNGVFTSTSLSVAQAISNMLYPCEEICTEPHVSGGVYYKNDAGEDIPVDCATVEITEATEQTHVFHFRDGLPNAEATQTDITGRFLLTRVPSGRIYINAFANGEQIGSVSTLTCTPEDSTGGVFAGNTVRIYTDKPTDPTPDCPQYP